MSNASSKMSARYSQLRASGMPHAQAFSQTGKEFQSAGENMGSFKTKSIFDNLDKEDGTRVSVMRWHYPEEKYKGRYHEWKREFAPSDNLLRRYKRKEIYWNEYEKRYVKETQSNQSRPARSHQC